MGRITKYVLSLFVPVAFSFSVQGRVLSVKTKDSVQLSLSGTIQPRFTYADDNFTNDGRQKRTGFGLRRVRMILDGSVGRDFHFFVQYDAAASDNRVSLVDASIAYEISERLSLRIGRFVSAEPRAFALTSHRNMDGANRAFIAETWAQRTLGSDGRDFGLEAKFQSERLEMRGFFHNGYNLDNFKAGVSNRSSTADISDNAFAGSFSVNYKPAFARKLEVGGFAGINNDANPNTELLDKSRTYISYSGHVYWGGKPGESPVRLKGDFIAVDYSEVAIMGINRINDIDQDFYGMSGLAAFGPFPWSEIFLRYEHAIDYYPAVLPEPVIGRLNFHDMHIFNVGINLSISELFNRREFNMNKLTLSAALKRGETDLTGDVYTLMAQYQFVF